MTPDSGARREEGQIFWVKVTVDGEPQDLLLTWDGEKFHALDDPEEFYMEMPGYVVCGPCISDPEALELALRKAKALDMLLENIAHRHIAETALERVSGMKTFLEIIRQFRPKSAIQQDADREEGNRCREVI